MRRLARFAAPVLIVLTTLGQWLPMRSVARLGAAADRSPIVDAVCSARVTATPRVARADSIAMPAAFATVAFDRTAGLMPSAFAIGPRLVVANRAAHGRAPPLSR